MDVFHIAFDALGIGTFGRDEKGKPSEIRTILKHRSQEVHVALTVLLPPPMPVPGTQGQKGLSIFIKLT